MIERNIHIAKIGEKKRGRGRPRKAGAANQIVPVALSKDLVERIDQWCKREGIEFRSAAMRSLIELGLAVAGKRTKKAKPE